jgi:hypothetical protein
MSKIDEVFERIARSSNSIWGEPKLSGQDFKRMTAASFLIGVAAILIQLARG